MEIKREPKIKSMKYEDFNDNEYLEKMVAELRDNNTNVIVGCLDELIEWGRSNSLWPLTFATSCCGIEFMAVGAARYDFARFVTSCQTAVQGIYFYGIGLEAFYGKSFVREINTDTIEGRRI